MNGVGVSGDDPEELKLLVVENFRRTEDPADEDLIRQEHGVVAVIPEHPNSAEYCGQGEQHRHVAHIEGARIEERCEETESRQQVKPPGDPGED